MRLTEFEKPAAEIVRKIIENIEDDSFDSEEATEMAKDESADFWIQIDGDANPWKYGGTWYNAEREQVVWFDGSEDAVTTDPDKIEVPPQVLAKINARVHDPYLDTPEGQEDPTWLQRMLRYEDNERDNLIGRYQAARAEFLDNRTPHHFWIINTSHLKPNDSLFQKYDERVADMFGEEFGEEFKNWPPYRKIVEIARYIGIDQIGHPVEWTHAQAKKELGAENI